MPLLRSVMKKYLLGVIRAHHMEKRCQVTYSRALETLLLSNVIWPSLIMATTAATACSRPCSSASTTVDSDCSNTLPDANRLHVGSLVPSANQAPSTCQPQAQELVSRRFPPSNHARTKAGLEERGSQQCTSEALLSMALLAKESALLFNSRYTCLNQSALAARVAMSPACHALATVFATSSQRAL